MSYPEEFLELIDKAILAANRVQEEARHSGKDWMLEDGRLAETQFKKIAEQVQKGTLPREEGAGLGISRALGEWAPDYLLEAGTRVEDFYREKWWRP